MGNTSLLRVTASLFPFVVLTGCGGGGAETGPLVATRDSLGDTVLVRVASGSLWGRPMSLHEDLRLGSLEGEDDAESFGSVLEIAVDSDGTIFVFDEQVPALLRFSKDGDFLGRVGREGQGPGEYGSRPNGLMVDRDGRVVLSDPDNARISVFSSEGEFLGLLGRVTGLRSLFGRMVAGDDRGRIYVRVLMMEPGPDLPTPWPIGTEMREPDGTVMDTIPPASIDGEAAEVVGIHRDGSMVAASADRFVFEIQSAGSGVVRVEMPYQRVPYTEREQARLGIALRPAAAADGRDQARLPESKPAYIDVLFDPLDRIWLRRPVEPSSDGDATVIPRFQPSVLDVFARDGTYLGVVKLPLRTRPVAVTETHLYAVQMGEYDEEYVVRFEFEW